MWQSRRSSIAALMWGVALVAVLLGGARTQAGQIVLFIAFMALPWVLLVTAVTRFAPRGRRGIAFTWFASVWPIVPCLWVHACWLAEFVQLGRTPALGDRTPWTIIAAQAVLFGSCGLSILSPFAVIFGTIVWDHGEAGRHMPSKLAGLPVFVMFVTWAVVILISDWDPVGAIYWAMNGF